MLARRDRARLDGRNRGTIRSAEPWPPPRYQASSVGLVWISPPAPGAASGTQIFGGVAKADFVLGLFDFGLVRESLSLSLRLSLSPFDPFYQLSRAPEFRHLLADLAARPAHETGD